MKFPLAELFSFLTLFAAGFSAEPSWALDPEEVHKRLQEEGDLILFIDVRDPVEIMFVGFTDSADINIPYRLVNTSELNQDEDAFAMPLNPRFADEVRRALQAKGLSPESTIITMCRTGGARGRPSAAYLRENGFPNAWYVENGFQGEPVSGGKHDGHRIQNGWKNSGLPWQPGFDADKIYRVPADSDSD